MNTYNIY